MSSLAGFVSWRTRTWTDEEVLNFSKINNTLFVTRGNFGGVLPTDVKGVVNGEPYVDLETLRIYVSKAKFLKEIIGRNIDLERIYKHIIAHENYHVVGPPFGVYSKTFIDYITKLASEYVDTALPEQVAGEVINIVADVVLESLIVLTKEMFWEDTVYMFYKLQDVDKASLSKRDPGVLWSFLMTHRVRTPENTAGVKPKYNSPRTDALKPLIDVVNEATGVDPMKFREEYEEGRPIALVNDPNMEELIRKGVVKVIQYFATLKDVFPETAAKAEKMMQELGVSGTLTADELVTQLLEVMPDEPLDRVFWVSAVLMVAFLSLYTQEMGRGAAAATSATSLKEVRAKPIRPNREGITLAGGRVYAGELLPPDEAERVAKRILKEGIVFSGTRTITRVRTGSVNLPFLEAGGVGIPIEATLESPVPTDWSIMIPYVIGYEKLEVPTSEPPKSMSIVIDTSGSTMDTTMVIAPLTGAPTTVADAERVIALAFVIALKKAGAKNTKVTITKFSNGVTVEEGRTEDAYRSLRDGASSELWWEFGGTNIIGGLRAALQRHVDGSKNPILLFTDMAVSKAEADAAYAILESRAPRSPKLVVVINPGDVVLGKLSLLNSKKNSAVVVMKKPTDVVKLLRAVRKVSSSVFR